MIQPPKTVQLKLNLGFVELSGEWEPNDLERRASWELYVELVSRVAIVPLDADSGLLREALGSFYSLFGTTREIMRRYGPDIAEPKRSGEYNFGILAVGLLNAVIRPLLARWHPELEDWEVRRPVGRSRAEHEREWDRSSDLRRDIDRTRSVLIEYGLVLATACGVPDLARLATHPGAIR